MKKLLLFSVVASAMIAHLFFIGERRAEQFEKIVETETQMRIGWGMPPAKAQSTARAYWQGVREKHPEQF